MLANLCLMTYFVTYDVVTKYNGSTKVLMPWWWLQRPHAHWMHYHSWLHVASSPGSWSTEGKRQGQRYRDRNRTKYAAAHILPPLLSPSVLQEPEDEASSYSHMLSNSSNQCSQAAALCIQAEQSVYIEDLERLGVCQIKKYTAIIK